MAKQIRWTEEAEVSFEKIIDYLLEDWTEREVRNFVSATNKTLDFISAIPECSVRPTFRMYMRP